jgi:hypothetical protein
MQIIFTTFKGCTFGGLAKEFWEYAQKQDKIGCSRKVQI